MAIDYQKEGKIAIFTINRPDALNSINVQTARELHEAMVDFRDDDGLWAGIITGAGDRAFCVGADIKDMLPFLKENLSQHPWAMPATHMRGLDLWKLREKKPQRNSRNKTNSPFQTREAPPFPAIPYRPVSIG